MKSPFLHRDRFTLPPPILARPSIVIGEAGSGKTETLLRIAFLAALYDYIVLYFDAKGDAETAARFVAVMRQAGKERIKVFPYRPYYGWVGNSRTLFNRLMAVQTYSESYYEGMASMMLDLALKAPGGPPRSSTDLLALLTLDRLRMAYRGLPEQDELARITPADANGVYNRYRAFFKALDGKLDSGFTFDETDAAYILLDSLAFQKETSSIGRYLIEDLSHYATARKPKEQKVLVIIDEVSALAIEQIANLVERLRSFHAPVILACQSEEGLSKNQDERTRILKAAHMLILHTSNAPERLIERAGKHKQVNAGWSVRGDEGTGYGTLRLTDEYIVSPDEVRRLGVGECFVLVQGNGYNVRVAPMQVSTEQLAEAHAFMQSEQDAAQEQQAVDATPAPRDEQAGPLTLAAPMPQNDDGDQQHDNDEADKL